MELVKAYLVYLKDILLNMVEKFRILRTKTHLITKVRCDPIILAPSQVEK